MLMQRDALYRPAFRFRRKANSNGFVYFVLARSCCQQFVKIGFTLKDPRARLKSLKTGCPFPLELVAFVRGGRSLEGELQDRFYKLRAEGEWYRYEGELASFMEGLAQ